ncbi:MAG: hypothetical protein KJZ54_08290 [Phycisphaerales bacterium]|nr:hypothetical protein [Phycisphaerales bacterium]
MASRRTIGAAFIASAILGVVAGCVDIPRGFDSPEPAARLDAAAKAAREGDLGSLAELIRMLESSDPASRLAAIRALERLTGETMGYDHAGSVPERAEAVERWWVWYGDTGAGWLAEAP